MFKRNTVLVAGVVAMLALVSTVSSHAVTASALSHIDHVTFSQPVALPGVTLPAGTYNFELGPPGTHPDLVRVSGREGQHYYLGFTREVPRPRGLPRNEIMVFGEHVAGTPAPIAVWYPVNSQSGHEFVYR